MNNNNPTTRIGSLIDDLMRVRLERQKYEDEIKKLNEKKELIEIDLINLMETHQLTKGAGKLATATYNIKMFPQISDKILFYQWAVNEDHLEFVQARVNSAPVKEMFENQNILPPGVTSFDKAVINLRKR